MVQEQGAGSKPGDEFDHSSLEPADHAESIFLDEIGPCKFVLTNVLSYEKAMLPDGERLIEHDRDTGTSAAFEARDDEVEPRIIPTDEILKKHLFKHGTGELFIAIGDLPPASLDSMRMKYSVATIHVQSGPSAAQLHLQSYVFHLPRAGDQRMFWDIAQVYTVCNMQTQKGQTTLWVAKGKARWRDFLKSICDTSFFVYSSHGNAKCEGMGGVILAVDKCLPSLCVSTFGWLLLHMRFAYAAKQSGGLEDKDARAAAKACLVRLMAPIAESSEMRVLTVELSEKFVMRWPRPRLGDSRVVELRLEGGILDLEPLHLESVGRQKSILAAGWRSAVKSCMKDRAPLKVSFMLFLERCGVAKELSSFIGQLVWQASAIVERSLGKESKKDPSDRQAVPLQFSWKDRHTIFGLAPRSVHPLVGAGQPWPSLLLPRDG